MSKSVDNASYIVEFTNDSIDDALATVSLNTLDVDSLDEPSKKRFKVDNTDVRMNDDSFIATDTEITTTVPVVLTSSTNGATHFKSQHSDVLSSECKMFISDKFSDGDTDVDIGITFCYDTRPVEIVNPVSNDKRNSHIAFVTNRQIGDDIDTTGTTVEVGELNDQGELLMGGGSIGNDAANPTYSFLGDTNSGVHNVPNTSVNVSVDGVDRMVVSTTDVTTSVPLDTPSITFGGSVLDTYEEGTHNTTWGTTLFGTAIAGNIDYTKIGNRVTLTVPDVFGTGVAAATDCPNVTVLPAMLRPAKQVEFLKTGKRNNLRSNALVVLNTSGSITFYSSETGASYAGSGTEGFYASTFTYLV